MIHVSAERTDSQRGAHQPDVLSAGTCLADQYLYECFNPLTFLLHDLLQRGKPPSLHGKMLKKTGKGFQFVTDLGKHRAKPRDQMF